MYSQYWNTARRRRPDSRRFTVVEGETPLPLGSTCRRKRLHSAGEEDQEARRSCASRPNPEGSLSAGDLSHYSRAEEEEEQEEEQEEELQRLCQRCHIMASQLNRQAAALADTTALKDPAYASFLFNKLQRLQWPRRGRHVSIDARCDVCGASFQLLRHLALRRALGFRPEMTPRPTTPSIPASEGSQVKQLEEEQQCGGGATWGWGGVQSTYLGGGGVRGLATVTPLPLNAQDDLEGVWRVSCRPEPQHSTVLTSDGGHVTVRTLEVKPTSHSVATQTSRPPSFFLRAVQKLSLSRGKKSEPGPPSPPGEVPGPLLYMGGFSGALQLSPPAVPPSLLRAGSKVKDTPGMGKVRVMVRICSAHSSESSESMSFLRVDGRKKQLILNETSTAQRRPAAPKTFTFDAVFSQDASQAEVCSGAVAEVIQSVVNGADGCIFCFGHANLGKTYTMIGQDCSTQSLGVAPTAVSWLFKVIEERREKAAARFSVRVSAVEISGREETLTDLLAELSSSAGGHQEAPGAPVSLREDPICGSQLQNQTELRATSAERAAFFLDAAVAARRSSRTPDDQEARRNSHFLFTLHLYQERLDKSSKAAVSGRSRLHLLDLGSCETDISRTREGGGGQCLSLSALGNVVLALANGAKHVPYRDSKLTMLLSESLGNINCRTTMIAHVSDSPARYMETLTTVQLAARIHRTRTKKSKYASSSSGGESSCEEGPSRPTPHLRPFHPRTVALDPDRPPVLSSDPDYSSSSEHSCDTVIYVGPGGKSVSDRELSDNEGPPSFVPIIPSLNKKRVKDRPRSDGDQLKCDTFAELQERLDCIDGSEGNEAKAALSDPTTSPSNSERKSTQNTATICTNKPDQGQRSSAGGHTDTSKRTSADGEKLSVASFPPCLGKSTSQDSEPVVREKVYLRGGVPKPSASPSLPRTASQAGHGLGRTPPVGMSQQATSWYDMEVSNLRAALLGRYVDGDFMRTTVTLQQPVELNGEDELVFTVIEELPLGLVPDNGRPNLPSGLSRQPGGSRPVSIISSINDEFDAYISQRGAEGPDAGCQEIMFRPQNQWCASSGEVDRSASWNKNMDTDNSSMVESPSVFHKHTLLPHSLKSSLNDSGICFSELDSHPATPNKPLLTKPPPSPDSTKDSLKLRANTLNTSGSRCSLPRKNKPTSSAAVGCCRQEGRPEDSLLQGNIQFDPSEVEFLSAGKPQRSGITSVSSKKSGGNSNSVPRPPKAQPSSSAQRLVDGCEKSSSRRGDTLVKLPRLTRGATTLGTVSTPQTSESRWGHESACGIGTLRYSSLGKKSNGQKSSMNSKPGSGIISPLGPPVRQSSQELKSRTPIALKTSSDTGKSLFPKTSASEEEVTVRLRADSFSHRVTSLKSDQGSARTCSSLNTQRPRADTSRFLGTLEKCDGPTSAGSKPEVLKENSRSNRSVPRLGVPASTSTSSSHISPGVVGTTFKLGQVRGGSGSLKIRTLSSSSSKNQGSGLKPPDNTGLPPSGKNPARSGTGVKGGRGTVMGMKQAISRAANSRVSELASGSPRKQLSRGSGATGSDGTDSGTSSASGSPVNTLLPSPYSKITAPRRPQRYSSGHGSDNSSILSGELPPAMGRTALFYHSGGSSGYESMIRDSTSSAHDSMSESGASSSRSRVSKSPKKRGNGFLRRRLIPTPLPDVPSLGRKAGTQWVDRPPLKDAFEIKVYEIDDVERLQRRRGEEAESEPFHDVEKGLLYLDGRLRMMEKRQQQIRDMRLRHERLKDELEETKRQLMMGTDRWRGQFDVDEDLDQESQEYLEVLSQVTSELEDVVNVFKSRVMMETCFDITMTTTSEQGPGDGVET